MMRINTQQIETFMSNLAPEQPEVQQSKWVIKEDGKLDFVDDEVNLQNVLKFYDVYSASGPPAFTKKHRPSVEI